MLCIQHLFSVSLFCYPCVLASCKPLTIPACFPLSLLAISSHYHLPASLFAALQLCSFNILANFLLLFSSYHISILQRGSYLLVTRFHFYENSLHSFINTSASPFTAHCCDGHNCTGPCNTVLNYCFKEVGTVNSFDDDSTILHDCVGSGRSLTELVEPSDSIDFSDPPLSISGSPTWSSLSKRGNVWPVSIPLSLSYIYTLPARAALFSFCRSFF